jgi:hypothetical protein
VTVYHLLNGANRGGAPDETYVSEVNMTFNGPVIVDRDQLRISQDKKYGLESDTSQSLCGGVLASLPIINLSICSNQRHMRVCRTGSATASPVHRAPKPRYGRGPEQR